MAVRRRKRTLKKFTNRMRKKVLMLFALIAILLIGLVGRIIYIQYTKGDSYSKIVLSQQEYNSETIPYQRGNIVDTNGTVLATSVDVYNVVLDCKVINSEEDYLEPTVNALVECIPDLDAETLKTEIVSRGDSQYYVVAKQLEYSEIEDFIAIQDDSTNNPNVKGVWFEKEYVRQYPYNSLASTIIGFTTSGNEGINGLENYYNDTLNGVNGREYGYLNTDNDFEKTVIEAENGETLVTTIDANIQSVVEQKIADFNEQYTDGYREGAGSENTAVVVMNPNNGEVLAMAEYPNYDLNNPRDLTAYYTQEEIDAMDSDTQLSILNDLWQNYCITETYEPGSTAKLFTVAAGLENGVITGEDDETFYCDGYQDVGGYHIKCVNTSGHGTETVQQAIMNSCNDVMMQIAEKIGVVNFTKYLSIFNIGQKTNIDLPGEARTDSLIYTADSMNATALATNSFGQNYNVTMIQMVSAYSSIINGGTYYQPHVVKKILDSDGNTVETIEPTVLRETISEETSEKLKQYLYATVSEGTAKTAKVDGYSMGGKTGTAETLPRGNKEYLVSFIGYVPADDPQVLVYVIINKPNAEDQAHSTFAQQLAKDILTDILPYMNIYPDEETTDDATEDTTADTVTPETTTDATGDTTTDTTGDTTAGDGTTDTQSVDNSEATADTPDMVPEDDSANETDNLAEEVLDNTTE